MGTIYPGESVEGKACADKLCDNSGKSRASDTKAQEFHEGDIQNGVQYGADHQVVKGPLGVAHGLEYAAAGVVHDVAEASQEVDLEVGDGIIHNIGGGAHPAKKHRGKKVSPDGHDDSHDDGKGDTGVSCRGNSVIVLGAVALADDDAVTHEQSADKAHHEKNKASGGAYRSQGLFSQNVSHNNRVNNIVELLKKLSEKQGDCKRY